MPSDNTYNNATAIASSPEQSQNPWTYQHAVADDFHHHRQPPQVSAVAFQAESLPCPRCDSKNTKFCYYNNYNLSQPRHFCKACRRYWTHGGTLRNIPVGGGTRKSTSISYHSNKRPRSSTATISNCSSSPAMLEHDGAPITKPLEAGFIMATGVIASADGVGAVAGGSPGSGFPSHLSMPSNNTFLALGEYGPGSMPALDWFRFGFSQGVLPFAEAGFTEGGGYGSFHGPMVCPAGIEAWKVGPGGDGGSSGDGKGGGGGGGGGGLSEGEGFPWPELAISMPGQGLK